MTVNLTINTSPVALKVPASPVALRAGGLPGPAGASGSKGDPGGNALAVGLFGSVSGLSIPTGTDLIQTSGYAATGVGSARYKATTNTGATLYRVQSSNGRWFELCEPFPTVSMFGAVGDNFTDCTAAAQALLDQGYDLVFPAGSWKTTATLTMSSAKQGQRIRCLEGATIYPHFRGDVVQMLGLLQRVDVVIDGTYQPGSGACGAGVRIGKAGALTSAWCSLGQSSVSNFTGSAYIHEEGEYLDLAQSSCTDIQRDFTGANSPPTVAAFTGVISGSVLTASAVTNAIQVGAILSVGGAPTKIQILSQLTGSTGGAGTYSVSPCPNVSSSAMTSVLPFAPGLGSDTDGHGYVWSNLGVNRNHDQGAGFAIRCHGIAFYAPKVDTSTPNMGENDCRFGAFTQLRSFGSGCNIYWACGAQFKLPIYTEIQTAGTPIVANQYPNWFPSCMWGDVDFVGEITTQAQTINQSTATQIRLNHAFNMPVTLFDQVGNLTLRNLNPAAPFTLFSGAYYLAQNANYQGEMGPTPGDANYYDFYFKSNASGRTRYHFDDTNVQIAFNQGGAYGNKSILLFDRTYTVTLTAATIGSIAAGKAYYYQIPVATCSAGAGDEVTATMCGYNFNEGGTPDAISCRPPSIDISGNINLHLDNLASATFTPGVGTSIIIKVVHRRRLSS